MDGRVHGLVPGPAQGALFRPVGGRTFPARATPARWRQVLIKPPEDLPPFLCALAGSICWWPMRILVIEDDRDAAAYLVKAFRETGHVVDLAHDGVQGYDLAVEGGYDVAIVDRMLPKMDGLTLVGALRSQKNETPVLILSALGQVDDRVKGLRAGGDDYLAKPYAFSELLARVETLARRVAPQSADTVYRVGDLELDRLSHTVTRAGKEIPLQPREFRLLEYLMR